MKMNRRDFVKATGTAAAVAMVGMPHLAFGAASKVVVVGGGTGGTTAAKYIKRLDPSIDVTIVEPNKTYFTCYFSNEVIAGERDMKSLEVGYDDVKKMGISVVFDSAEAIDGAAKTVKTASGQSLTFDRCVVSRVSSLSMTRLRATRPKSPTSRCRMPGRPARKPSC
jgi:sulfide dehydrogenase [flavocytochrome c] flavoprotein subunit